MDQISDLLLPRSYVADMLNRKPIYLRSERIAMKFKNVTLPESHWDAICVTLEHTDSDNDKQNAAMIREQLSGVIKVVATKKTVSFRAPRGGDLRNALLAGKL